MKTVPPLLVSQFQLSAVGERPWDETLGAMSDYFRATGTALAVLDPALGVVAVRVHGVMPPELAAFARIEVGEVYAGRDVLVMRFVETVLACLTEVDDERVEAFHMFAPAVEQALALGALVEREAVTQAALLDALSLKADGIVLLDGVGHPSFMNAAASAILRRRDGLCEQDGELRALRLPETRRLHGLIAEARTGATADARMLVSRRAGMRPYVVHCLPAPVCERFFTAHAIASVIHIHDLGASQGASPGALTAIFGLTDREAQLASALSRRGQLGQAATEANMAYNTARNHLQSIFRKTGTTNQVEVAQLLARLP